jgi:ankyrin repeat protein
MIDYDRGFNQAIADNDIEKIRLLIENKHDLNQRDILGDTPLNLAVKFDRLEIFKLLLESGATITTWTIADITETDGSFCMEMLSLVLESGIDVNLQLEDGETLLMYAVGEGNLKIVERLVELGADINAVSRQADFALLIAGYRRHQEIFDYLAPKTISELKEQAAERLPIRWAKQLKD